MNATKSMLDESMLGATLIGLCSSTLASEIAQGLVLRRRHPNRRQISSLVGLGEFLGLTTVGLDLVAGPLGDERRGDDLAFDPHLGQLPVQGVARGPAL